jgi:hypothetical protein
MAANVFPREGQGFRAEVKIGDDIQLVLIVAHTAVGPVVGIYEAKAKKWRDRQWAEDIDDAKAKASATARNWWYRNIGRKEPFPPLDWQATG